MIAIGKNYEAPRAEVFEVQVEQPLLNSSRLFDGEGVNDDELLD